GDRYRSLLTAPAVLRSSLPSGQHTCCFDSAGVSRRFRSPNLDRGSFQGGEPVRPLHRPSAAMTTLSVLALMALIASCHFDKLFSGGGETPLSHDPPAGLAFATSPGNARAGQQLSQFRVAVVDSRGTPVAGADSLITVALGAHPSGAALTGTTSARAVNGAATFSDLRIDKPGTGYTLTATVTGLTPDTSAAFDIMPEPVKNSEMVKTTTKGT